MTSINPNTLLNEKLVMELNGALAMENAGIERLQMRIAETLFPPAKRQMQYHLQQGFEHQTRLRQIITHMGALPTTEKLGLPIPSYPQSLMDVMKKFLTKQEWDLKRATEDLIVENAEVAYYFLLLQKVKIAGEPFSNLIEPMSRHLQDEVYMAEWIRTHSPGMLAALWPSIQSASLTILQTQT
jgi:ferritin-like metal-binding protein YciE